MTKNKYLVPDPWPTRVHDALVRVLVCAGTDNSHTKQEVTMEHEFEWREVHGLPIRYCIRHGQDAAECRKMVLVALDERGVL